MKEHNKSAFLENFSETRNSALTVRSGNIQNSFHITNFRHDAKNPKNREISCRDFVIQLLGDIMASDRSKFI